MAGQVARAETAQGRAQVARWVDGPLVGFDTETTGVDVLTDRIVSAAVVRRADGTTTVHTWLVDPGIDIPPAATAIHGMTSADAHARGLPARLALDEIADRIAAEVRDGTPLVAYNASYDLTLLDVELRRHGLATLAERLDGAVPLVLDPLVLDRHLDRYRLGARRLGTLCEHYGVQTEAALHAADVDVLATLDVLRAIAAAYPEVASLPLPQVHDLQVAANLRWAEGVNTWREAEGLSGPGAEQDWPQRPPEPAPAGSG